MTKDILFDNIYIGHSIEEADKLRKETFDVKKKIETEEDEATKPMAPESPKAVNFKEDPVAFLKEKLEVFFAVAQKDPVGAFKTFPEVGGVLAAGLFTVLAVLVSLISMATAPSAAPKKAAPASDKKPETKIQEAAEAESSGSEKPKASRRTSKKA